MIWPDVYRGVDARQPLPEMAPVDLTVTSTPYLWRSKYSDETDEFGAGSLEQFLADQVALARNISAASRPGGWYVLNLADSRSNTGGAGGDINKAGKRIYRQGEHGLIGQQWIGAPWQSAFAIRAATDWQLAGYVVWGKARPVRTDNSAYHLRRNRRPGLEHEYVFMFWKPGGPQTWNPEVLLETPYDRDAPALAAILERFRARGGRLNGKAESDAAKRVKAAAAKPLLGSVWQITPSTLRPPWAQPSDDVKAFPVELPERCIQLLSNPGDRVLDPCAGYGTTGVAALRHGRVPVMFDLFWGTVDWEQGAVA